MLQQLKHRFRPEEPTSNAVKYISFTVAFVLLGVVATSIGLTQVYADKVFPGVYIGDVAVGTRTPAEVQQMLENEFAYYRTGIEVMVQHNNEQLAVTLPSSLVDEHSGLSYNLFSYDIDAMVDEAYEVGRSFNIAANIKNQINGFTHKTVVPLRYAVNEEIVRNELQKILSINGVTSTPQDAILEVSMLSNTRFHAELTPEVDGVSVDYDAFTEQLRASMQSNKQQALEIRSQNIPATIRAEMIPNYNDDIRQAIGHGSVLLHNGTISWSITPKIYGDWLGVIYDNGSVRLGFKKDAVQKYLTDYIQPAVTKEPVNAQFTVEDGKVTTFKASQVGQDLLLDESYQQIQQAFFDNKETNINLAIQKTQPEIATEQVNDLGIKEIIGIGRSSFAGSPANRRHNIAVGAASVNGTIIPPGEEFSLLTILGEIDGENGYKEELVIKGNETIPEFGGGLCQIGTTAFRGALDAGLEITERRNHSYRVSYYEPAGTDATIYDPAPDFKFRNDTAHHLLVLTKIQGDDLIYEFWGTHDGRKSVVGKPRIYDIQEPPPTKLIETDELPPGEKKCTERAHNGAKAELTRTVQYADGTENTQTWKSYYRPWQEVCLIGRDPNAAAESEETDLSADSSQLLSESGVHIPQEPVE